jgi:catechol 2,3-dioxygenase-like lactoylglutathione lyase family enzyme
MTESTYHHVGILVPDMDAAIAWFSEVLGVTFHAPHRMITYASSGTERVLRRGAWRPLADGQEERSVF